MFFFSAIAELSKGNLKQQSHRMVETEMESSNIWQLPPAEN